MNDTEQQRQDQEEREQAVMAAIEECRVSIGAPRGDRIAALLYNEIRLPNPQVKHVHES